MATTWAYEGVQCYVATEPIANHVPLYRSFNGADHFYTTNQNEYDNLPEKYHREGIACCVASSQLPGHVALYRLYRKRGDDHFYTTDENEKNTAVQNNGYVEEDIIGYCQSNETAHANHIPFYRAYHPGIVDHFYTTSITEIESVAPKISKDDLKKFLAAGLFIYSVNGCRFYLADNQYLDSCILTFSAQV